MGRRTISLRTFRCPVCGTIITAPIRAKHQSPKGHLKWIWCIKCKKKQNFIMIDSELIYD